MVGLVLPAEGSETGFGELWRLKGPVREDKTRNMKGEKKRKTRKKKEERRKRKEDRSKEK
jgi:hypothetical protein